VSALGGIGVGAVAVLAAVWLAVSFQRESRRRTLLEWLGADALYVALLTFFASLLRRSLAEGSALGIAGFGFLATLFALGLVVAVWKTLGVARGRREDGVSATN
jgi:D-arabinose 1-dehydrogenase-like Zn-dependent alcohol dehydrogenase